MSDIKTFAGITVHGYGDSPYHHYKTQLPREDLEQLFVNALNHPEVAEIKWKQYTPYFNDGDPCYFSADDVTFLLDVSEDSDGDYEDGFLYASDVKIQGGDQDEWSREARTWVKTGKTFPKHPAADDLSALTQLSRGEFDNVLQELFGDHVEVAVTRQGITVDEYSHD